MSTHTDKTYAALTGTPAPRDLAWTDFVALWKQRADSAEEESGDRLAVQMNGHRVVFHRPHDGRVSIEDVERARHLLAATATSEGSGSLLVVAIDAEHARIIDFDLNATDVEDTARTITDEDARAHHLRTVERHTGHDDQQDLHRFYDQVADALRVDGSTQDFVVVGHGDGKADVAVQFVERLGIAHHDVAARVVSIKRVDLSTATDAIIEAAAIAAVRSR